jgi:hypothetical protein
MRRGELAEASLTKGAEGVEERFCLRLLLVLVLLLLLLLLEHELLHLLLQLLLLELQLTQFLHTT